MQYRDAIDMILARAHMAGLHDDEGRVDAIDAETALLAFLQRLVARYDLDAFTVINESIARTFTGLRHYALPEDFGRLMQPNDRDEHGMFLHDGTNIHTLTYRHPNEWFRLQATSNNRPSHFTISGREIHLDPAPDANSGSHYTLRGAYVKEIDDFSLDDELPIPISVAEDGALAQLAIDKDGPTARAWSSIDRKSTRLNSSHSQQSRMPSSA